MYYNFTPLISTQNQDKQFFHKIEKILFLKVKLHQDPKHLYQIPHFRAIVPSPPPTVARNNKRESTMYCLEKLGPSKFESTLYIHDSMIHFDLINNNGNKACLHVPPCNWAMKLPILS